MNASSAALKGLRRALVIIIIVAFAAAAAIGIWMIVAGGNSVSETTSKILGTTALIGGVSLTALCHLAIVGRAIRVVGFVGLIASLAMLVTGLVMIWQPYDSMNYDFMREWGRAFQLSLIAAVFLAQVNLLLLLSQRKHRAIQISLYVTFTAIALLYALGIWTLYQDDPNQAWPDFWRFIAVAAIIDALGTIVTPVLGLVLKKKEPLASAVSEPASERVNVTLTADQVLKLQAAHPGKSLADALLAELDD